jgi:hypothetical protein
LTGFTQTPAIPAAIYFARIFAHNVLYPSAVNQLYNGDNKHVLREPIADASVDIIFLAQLFISNRDYNLTQRALIEAFENIRR